MHLNFTLDIVEIVLPNSSKFTVSGFIMFFFDILAGVTQALQKEASPCCLKSCYDFHLFI
jgi:hypothetical protein